MAVCRTFNPLYGIGTLASTAAMSARYGSAHERAIEMRCEKRAD